jgi:hypothetical protein
MAAANALWRAPRIHGELEMLGIAISERTVSRILRRLRPPPNPDVADFPAQPCRPNRIDRFLYSADNHHEGAVRIHHARSDSGPSLGCRRENGVDWLTATQPIDPAYGLVGSDKIDESVYHEGVCAGRNTRGRLSSSHEIGAKPLTICDIQLIHCSVSADEIDRSLRDHRVCAGCDARRGLGSSRQIDISPLTICNIQLINRMGSAHKVDASRMVKKSLLIENLT